MPTPINEELIVRYLLGELTEKEQVEIEDRAFQDQQYLQGILNVEADLIDEYARGEIPHGKRRQFENHFLASGERRRKVDFARALAALSSESAVTGVVRPVVIERQNPFAAFLRSLRPLPAFALATLALIMLGAAVWLIKDSISLRSQLARLRADQQSQEEQRRQLEEQYKTEQARNETLTTEIAQQKKETAERALHPEEQKPISPESPSSVVTLALLSGLVRDSGNLPTLTVTPATHTVRLQVAIDPRDDYPHFSVNLDAPGGARIWSQSNVTARTTRAGRAIVLDLPAKNFVAGRYELSLKGTNAAGGNEDIGYYYFEVVKK